MRTSKIIVPLMMAVAPLLTGLMPAPTFAADADCGQHVLDIVQQAYPAAQHGMDNTFDLGKATFTASEDANSKNDSKAVICRVWPAHPELTLVAVPLIPKPSDENAGGDIEVLVANSRDFKIKYRHRIEGILSDDAVRTTSISFDTAFYQMKAGHVAFGLRVAEEGDSRPNPFGDTALWLFTVDKDRLGLVVDGLLVNVMHGEWDTNCEGTFYNTDRRLSMQPSKKGDVADIVITETNLTTINKSTKTNDCDSQEKKTSRSLHLQYNGSIYPVSKELGKIE